MTKAVSDTGLLVKSPVALQLSQLEAKQQFLKTLSLLLFNVTCCKLTDLILFFLESKLQQFNKVTVLLLEFILPSLPKSYQKNWDTNVTKKLPTPIIQIH